MSLLNFSTFGIYISFFYIISCIKSLEITVRIIYSICRNPTVFYINSLTYLHAFFVLGLQHMLHSTHES